MFIAPLLPISSSRGNPCVHLNRETDRSGEDPVSTANKLQIAFLFCLMRLISSRRPLRRCRTAPRGGLPPPRPLPPPRLRFSLFESRRITKFHAAKRQTPPRRHPAGSPSGVFPRLQSLQPQRELHTSAKRNSASINKQTPRPGRTTTPRDGPAAHRARARRRSP